MTTLADARAIDSTPTRYLGSIEPRARAFDTIVLGGLTAGVLDILDAFAVSGLRGLGPTRVLHYIASGVLGPSASQGGMMTAALGFALHFVIALGAAATYLAASRKLPVLVRRPVVCGLAFGLAVWAFMRYVVVPLSLVRGGAGAQPLMLVMNQLAIHALGVGLPIALFASRSAQRYTNHEITELQMKSPIRPIANSQII